MGSDQGRVEEEPTNQVRFDSLVVRRLAIVDDDGVERITLEADSTQTRIVVRTGDSTPGQTTGVQIVALGPLDDGQTSVGIELINRGSIVATFDSIDP